MSSTLFLSLILQSCHKVLVLVRKENMARLKIGKNRPNVLLGLRSKYVFELNLMIGPTLISVVARTYLGSWMGGWEIWLYCHLILSYSWSKDELGKKKSRTCLVFILIWNILKKKDIWYITKSVKHALLIRIFRTDDCKLATM